VDKRGIGRQYEEMAIDFLELSGYTILEKNYTTKQGEIDVIALEKECYVFLEVKYRHSKKKGYPFEMVTKSKQKKIMKTAISYCLENKLLGQSMRFDIISILGEEITHYRNAFEMNPRLCHF